MRFSGKVVLVTGAGSGIGRALVAAFASEGARVLAIDKDEHAETFAGQPAVDEVVGVTADVSRESDVDRVVRRAVEQWGGVDVLCNNAGILDDYLRAEDTTTETWNRVISVNLTGPFLLSRAVIPHMVARGAGAIVNTASIAAFVAGGGGTAYTASKHGVLGLTRQLAFDYGHAGIRVNAVCPGAIASGMTAHLLTPDGKNEHVDAAIAATPAGRWGRPEEVARVVTFLASDDAAFVHGAAYTIDGGWLLP